MHIGPYDTSKFPKQKYMSYRWVRTHLLGIPDPLNVDQARSFGWRPVPFERYCDEPQAELWQRDCDEIRYGGMMLMERPDFMTMRAEADVRQKTFELEKGPWIVPERFWRRWMKKLGFIKQKGNDDL